MIVRFGSHIPDIDETAWVAPTATIIGDVAVGPDSSVWYNAVIRADQASVALGERTNVQDGCVLHADPGTPLRLGSNVTVGHNATLHGCTVEDNVLIGMGAILLNRAYVSTNSIIAAGALVPENFVVPERALVAGVPAKVRRTLTDDEVDAIRSNAENYVLGREAHRRAHADS
ncbi:gamma carbonic anhydrase family protein [Rhodococcus sp. 06-418-1B]|nr:gamma carbonic anhydrase family protein [Rhodococcus sp. 06-418-1B]OZC92982.1 gamma carbonic anhydrase family protein [Rhodococcus sp. 06-418-1B]